MMTPLSSTCWSSPSILSSLLSSSLLCLLLLSLSSHTAGRNHGHGQHGHEKTAEEKDAVLNASSIYTGATARSLPLRSWSTLPASFDWCDVDGVSYCTASWNQHIPKGFHTSPTTLPTSSFLDPPRALCSYTAHLLHVHPAACICVVRAQRSMRGR